MGLKHFLDVGIVTWNFAGEVKIFSNCKFLGFHSVKSQNKFLAIKFMTKIGQHKTSGNSFQKLKSLESSECWPKLYKTLWNWKLLMLTHENCHPSFWVEDIQNPNIFGCKIFSESIFLGLNWALHTHTPLRRISCHRRNYSQPYFVARNQSSDTCSHGFSAKFLL